LDDRTLDSAKKVLQRISDYMDDAGLSNLALVMQAAADVVLIVDQDGVILDAGFDDEELHSIGGRAWVGCRLTDTVTSESEPKLEAMMAEVEALSISRPHEINHAMPHGDDAPVRYKAAQFNAQGHVILFGQHIARMAALQRRLMSSQLAMEREFSRLRNAESRYRAIFQLADVPLIIVDAASLRIMDANSSAQRVLGASQGRLENQKLASLFGESQSGLVHKLLQATVDQGASESLLAQRKDGSQIGIMATLYRQDRNNYLLLQLHDVQADSPNVNSSSERISLELLDHMPDAFVICDRDTIIRSGNAAFLELFNLASMRDVEGNSLETLFDRPNVDCNVLMANVREHGLVRRFATVVRTRYGQAENVEVAASRAQVGEEEVFGLWFRPTSTMPIGTDSAQERVQRSNEQIANLVGHMPLKDIVRESTNMIEKLCIETALDLTNNNRASAAQMLGVSRQSLYAKLGRTKSDDDNT